MRLVFLIFLLISSPAGTERFLSAHEKSATGERFSNTDPAGSTPAGEHRVFLEIGHCVGSGHFRVVEEQPLIDARASEAIEPRESVHSGVYFDQNRSYYF